jgi:F0F1-type ATP synthase epsilon subunit
MPRLKVYADMFPALHLRVLTPEQILLDADNVRWVQAKLADGAGIGIWPGHGPLLAETVHAPLRYADERGEHALALQAGVLRVAHGQVTVYTTAALDGAGQSIAQPGGQ